MVQRAAMRPSSGRTEAHRKLQAARRLAPRRRQRLKARRPGAGGAPHLSLHHEGYTSRECPSIDTALSLTLFPVVLLHGNLYGVIFLNQVGVCCTNGGTDLAEDAALRAVRVRPVEPLTVVCGLTMHF